MSHQKDDYLDGPRLVEWLEAQPFPRGILTSNQKRRIYQWRHGGKAHIGAVDKLLIDLNLEGDLWQLEEMFLSESQGVTS